MSELKGVMDPLESGSSPGAAPTTSAPDPDTALKGVIDPLGTETPSTAPQMGGFTADPELPELGSSIALMLERPSDYDLTPSELKDIRSAVNVPRSIPGKVNALRRAVPDLGVKIDDEGVVVVNMRGQDYLLNRPGVSAQDVREIMVDMGFDIPAGVVGAGAGGMLAGNVGRVVGAGVGAAGGSIARDVVGQKLGSEQPIDKTMALIAGLSGGAFEALGIALSPFLRRLFTSKEFVEPGTRQLTKQGKAVLQRVGIDPDEVTPEFIDDFLRLQAETASPDVAARQAQVQALGRELDAPPVRMSRGDLTRQPADQALEDAARKGVQGEMARNQAAGFRAAQQEDLAATGAALGRRVGTGEDLLPGEGAARTQTALAGARDTLKGQVDEAYKLARATSAALDTESTKALGRQINRELTSSFNPATAPKTFKTAQQLATFETRFPGRVTRVKVNALENWRQQMAALARSSDPVESGAAKAAIGQYDDFMTKALDNALIQGDEAAVQAFRGAGRLRRQLFKQFESDKLVARIVKAEDGELLLTPTEAMNVLFTARAGSKTGAVRAVKKVADILGRESADFVALKQEAFLRLLGTGEGGLDDAFMRMFSGDKFASNVDKIFRQSPEMMATLFTREEIKTIRQFRNVALMATSRAPGAMNTSNTEIVRRLLGKMGFVGNTTRDWLRSLFGNIIEARAGRKAAEAFTRPLVPARPVIPGGVAGGAGAAAGQAGGREIPQ